MGLGSYVAVASKSPLHALAHLGMRSAELAEADETIEDWSLEPEARQILLSIVKATHPRNYLEIGAHRGTTCLAVAQLLKVIGRGNAYAIEPDTTLAREIQHCAGASELPLTVLPVTSAEAFEHWGREELDVVLVDGDHSFASAVFDIASWGTLLAADGYLLVHDTVSRLERRFPDDYIIAPRLFDIVDIVRMESRPSGHFWEGLAVLRWSANGRALRSARHLYRSAL